MKFCEKNVLALIRNLYQIIKISIKFVDLMIKILLLALIISDFLEILKGMI